MKNSQYLTADEKVKILTAFQCFIKSDFKKTQFTRALYQYLSIHFGFIAHYDINGFYEARFENPVGRASTFQTINDAGPWNFRDENTSGCADLNLAILDVVHSNWNEVMGSARTEYLKDLKNDLASLQSKIDSLS